MAFIVSKKSSRNGRLRTLQYLVENYREGSKIKRRKLLNLNEYKNLSELLEATEQEEAQLINRLSRFQQQLDDFMKFGKVPSLIFGSPYAVRKRLDWGIEHTKTDLGTCQKKMNEIRCFMK